MTIASLQIHGHRLFFLSAAVVFAACSSSSSPNNDAQTGGAVTGGAASTNSSGSTGGLSASGTSTGGSSASVGGTTNGPVGTTVSPGGSTASGGVTTASGGGMTTTGGRTSSSGATQTGGSSATGGSAGGTTNSGGTTSAGSIPGSCSLLPSPGQWQNITPPQLNMSNWCWPAWTSSCPGPGDTSASGLLATYGTNAFVIDPNNSATVYLGTSSLGIWKTTDCGATWVHINTGANGAGIDQGRNWTMVIDPLDSQVLYTSAGYGPGGLFKSTNGGVDWQQVLTPNVTTAFPYGGFVEKITMDPTNHMHLLVSAHGACTQNGSDWGCLGESTDAGGTWTLTNSAESWTEGDGQTMVDSTTWFFGSLFGGIWRTTDAGGSWTQVYQGDASGSVYTAADGTFYSTAANGVLHSTDGVNWSVLTSPPNGGNSNGGSAIVGNGQTLFISDGNGGTEPADGWYWSAPESNPVTWTSLHSPSSMAFGGIVIAYDADHHILYSSNYTSGFWRVVVQ